MARTNALQRMLSFVQDVAILTPHGECPLCRGNGVDDPPDQDCPNHYAYQQEHTSAVELVEKLVRRAREIERDLRMARVA